MILTCAKSTVGHFVRLEIYKKYIYAFISLDCCSQQINKRKLEAEFCFAFLKCHKESTFFIVAMFSGISDMLEVCVWFVSQKSNTRIMSVRYNFAQYYWDDLASQLGQSKTESSEVKACTPYPRIKHLQSDKINRWKKYPVTTLIRKASH